MIKKDKKIKLKTSLFLLFVAAILLISSSYAWFTSNQTVTVSSLNVNVQAKNGLQISTDGTTWKSIIQNADITGVHATTYPTSVNQIPAVLEPVSTIGNVTTGKLDMFYGTVGTDKDGDYTLSATQDADTEGATGRYIAFDLFFKVQQDTPVYISTNSGVVVKDGEASKGLENAARMAFINEGNIADGSLISAIQALNDGATSNIWELNYDTHTAAAVSNAYNTYGITTTTTGGSVLPYYGIKAVIPASADAKLKTATDKTYFSTVTPWLSTASGFSKNQAYMTLNAGITKVRVYMWVEGQDVDCENNASGADITYNLQVTSLAS